MDREVQELLLSVLGWAGCSSSRHRPEQVLADLALRRRSFRRWCAPPSPAGPSPLPGGGRWREMTARGGSGASAPIPGDNGAPGDEHLESGPRGGSRPRVPARMGFVAPAVSTPHRPTRTRQDLPCTSAGNPRIPSSRAISVPLSPVMSGLSRSLAETFRAGRSGTKVASFSFPS